MTAKLPETIDDTSGLDELLTRPRAVLVDFIRSVPSPLVVLGAAGKMGPTLCVLAKHAAEQTNHRLEVIAVSRFSDEESRRWLELNGVTTHRADLLNAASLGTLPEAKNVLYLVGLKFGTATNPVATWATNTVVPVKVAERYSRARIVVLSTGNVYPPVPIASGGAREDHALTPLGEYANSAVARERIFQHFSTAQGTPIALMRLNYAVELRYGVLVDIARKVWAGEPIDLSNGWFNCIWQGDANEMILRSLALSASPAVSWNLTGPVPHRVRTVAELLGELHSRHPRFTGREGETALLSDASKLCAVLGTPPTSLAAVLGWTAHWVSRNGAYLDRPTHFEIRNGQY